MSKIAKRTPPAFWMLTRWIVVKVSAIAHSSPRRASAARARGPRSRKFRSRNERAHAFRDAVRVLVLQLKPRFGQPLVLARVVAGVLAIFLVVGVAAAQVAVHEELRIERE